MLTVIILILSSLTKLSHPEQREGSDEILRLRLRMTGQVKNDMFYPSKNPFFRGLVGLKKDHFS